MTSEARSEPTNGVVGRSQFVRFIAGLIAVAGLLLVAYGLTTIEAGDPIVVLASVAGFVAALTLTLAGAILISRLPANPIGWTLAAGGLLFALDYSGPPLGAVLYEAGVGPALWLIWVAGMCLVPATVCVTVLAPLLFPTGQLPSTRWRVVVFIGFGAIVFGALQSAFSPFSSNVPASIQNPLVAGGTLADLLGLLGGLANLAGVVCLPLVAASLVLRYRAAEGLERAQLRWFAAVAAIIGPAFAIGIALSAETTEPAVTIANLAFLATFIGLALLPVAIGIAVLRYRLYDIDLIVRRTAVYVPLTAILAGLYAGTVALFQRLFVAVTGTPSDGAVILSTLILATLFTPIRSWLQGLVDRRFGDAGDAKHLLETFVGANMAATWALDPTRTMRAFLTVSVRAMGSTGGIAYVGADGNARPAAELGTSLQGRALTIPVEAAGHRVGRIELADRRGGRPYGDWERALLQRAAADLAGIVVESELPSAPEASRSVTAER